MKGDYDYQKHAILYVDDEPKALKYFEKAFAKEFQILTASGGAEAWQIIQSDPYRIGVLITDQRMPGESGVALLERASLEYPHIVRILTTAYSDFQTAIEAVNHGGAFRYVTKPWEAGELRGVLLRAMEFFLVRQDRDCLLREKLSTLQRMIVMDRVRGLAALAAAIGGQFRNSMDALKAYVKDSPLIEIIDIQNSQLPEIDLVSVARNEGESLVKAVLQVVRTIGTDGADVECLRSVDQILRDYIEGIEAEKAADGVLFELPMASELPQIKCSDQLVKRLIATLVERICDMDGDDRTIRFRFVASGDGEPLPRVILQILTNAPSWQNGQVASLFSAVIPEKKWPMGIDMDILSAYFIAHHYGGQLLVHESPPFGPGFEVTLRSANENWDHAVIDHAWFDDVFGSLERWGNIEYV